MTRALLKKDLKLLFPALAAGIVFVPAGYLIERFFGVSEMVAFLAFMLLAISLTIGASSISGEVERRTITLLVEKPVELVSIWVSKVIAALMVILTLHCIYYFAMALFFGKYHNYPDRVPYHHAYFISFPYMVFAFGLFFSALLDKSIIAAFLAIVFSIVASSFIGNTAVMPVRSLIPLEIAILALSALILSYWIFSTKFSIISRRRKIWACVLFTAILIFVIHLIPLANIGLYRLSRLSYQDLIHIFWPFLNRSIR